MISLSCRACISSWILLISSTLGPVCTLSRLLMVIACVCEGRIPILWATSTSFLCDSWSRSLKFAKSIYLIWGLLRTELARPIVLVILSTVAWPDCSISWIWKASMCSDSLSFHLDMVGWDIPISAAILYCDSPFIRAGNISIGLGFN